MSRYIFAFFQKNPDYPTTPLIDYNTVIVFTPTIIFGSAFGAILNSLLPEGTILIILAISILLGVIYTFYHFMTFSKKDMIIYKSGKDNTIELSIISEKDSLKEEMLEQKNPQRFVPDNQEDASFPKNLETTNIKYDRKTPPHILKTFSNLSKSSVDYISSSPTRKQYSIIQEHWVQILKIREAKICPFEKYLI